MFRHALMPNICIFVYTVTVFENEGFSDNTSHSLFQCLMRHGCIKRREIERLYACYMVDMWGLKCSNS